MKSAQEILARARAGRALVKGDPAWPGVLTTTKYQAKDAQVHLTPRQLEVLVLLCQGLPNKLICRQLNIATGTVKVHIGVILRELGVTSRLQAVVAAQRLGLLERPADGAAIAAAGRVVMVAGSSARLEPRAAVAA